MKKYETPAIELLMLDAGEFLSVSGDATAIDIFTDTYGKSFTDI